ncbi:hypothetical protein P3H15_32435 [Rhodococcus sp. T2V]|uniref:hypothetical protein n=1 Tax=Rhodococcus sp. T2V TaxID=3034164 RepID=UPI0023E1DB5E|nr:hypothetical protein [Rhodococcus sp. T2V]MDF3309727.1 hypothetical protein [Rhodococcus sp. T2V]
MIRSIVTAFAASALLVLGVGVATADTPDEVAAQCARATIPTALCGNGSGASTDSGIGKALKVDPGRYFSGNGPAKQIGSYDGDPIVDDNGEPVLDENGEPTFEQIPIMAAGDPIFTPKPSDPDAVDLSGYQYK